MYENGTILAGRYRVTGHIRSNSLGDMYLVRDTGAEQTYVLHTIQKDAFPRVPSAEDVRSILRNSDLPAVVDIHDAVLMFLVVLDPFDCIWAKPGGRLMPRAAKRLSESFCDRFAFLTSSLPAAPGCPEPPPTTRVKVKPRRHKPRQVKVNLGEAKHVELESHCLPRLRKRTAEAPPAISHVQFSALAPGQLTKGKYSIIDLFMYEESCREIIDVLMAADKTLQETTSGVFPVSDGARVRVVLTSPDIPIDNNEMTALWSGKYLRFNFAVSLPLGYAGSQVMFHAAVYINDLPATRLYFLAECAAPGAQKLRVTRSDVLSAFVSYASQDRQRVATLVQGMKSARPDMKIFFDVTSLRSGQAWEPALTAGIEESDVLYLCWSLHARASRWVDAEWRYALANKGLDAIEPIPIDPPELCPPPEELKHKHFNDSLLYIINAP